MHILQHIGVACRPLALTCGAALCAAAASAQSFNIDLGLLGTPPSAAYGAAAGQPGVWNEVASNTNASLVGLGGAATAVTVDVAALADFSFDNLATSGDDEALMDTLLDGPTTVIVNGLAPGNYVVYTYAWAPDNATYVTDVAVTGSLDPIQSCGGAWPGAHVLGTTFTRHDVTISGALPTLEIVFTLGSGFKSCNGVQIVGGSTSPGVNYCGPAVPNSTGNPGSISATGSATVANNDLTLVASDLPNNAFGYFLTSRTQAMVPQPGGSLGVLCVGGAIGRYVGPGQVLNTGTTGGFSLLIDNTQTPTPTGLVPIVAGETWNFTTWHRDAVGGSAVSNFTDGLAVTFN